MQINKKQQILQIITQYIGPDFIIESENIYFGVSPVGYGHGFCAIKNSVLLKEKVFLKKGFYETT